MNEIQTKNKRKIRVFPHSFFHAFLFHSFTPGKTEHLKCYNKTSHLVCCSFFGSVWNRNELVFFVRALEF